MIIFLKKCSILIKLKIDNKVIKVYWKDDPTIKINTMITTIIQYKYILKVSSLNDNNKLFI